jgi:hypothetical protein
VSIVSVVVPLWLLRNSKRKQSTVDLPEAPLTQSELNSSTTNSSRDNTLNFNELLNDPEQLEQFQDYLRKEFALENLIVSIRE